MNRCWCGCSELFQSFHTEYLTCSECGTFISKWNEDPVLLYSWEEYWHYHQNNMGFPSIEGRSISDFKDRIPKWYYDLRGSLERDSILEIGCAHGGFLSYCKEKGFTRCVGVEIDPKVCEYARNRFNLDEIYCGAFPDVFIEGKFDYVVGFDVLEHFPDPVSSLMAMKNLLVKGGRILIQTPWYRGEREKFVHFHPDEHLFIYTEPSVKKLFSMCGLTSTIKQGIFNWDMMITGGEI